MWNSRIIINLKVEWILLLLLSNINIIFGFDNENPIVELDCCGKIRATVDKSAISQKTYYEFKGIPYARPPVGLLRFEPPVKFTSKWDGERESKYSSICMQVDAFDSEQIIGDEDCLTINVFVPRSTTTSTKKHPVLVMIHGGAFMFESGSDYGPKYWMEEEIVYVTFNYRLGILGFYKSKDGITVPGNMGLKDQVLALEWVKENIHKFNGDAERITIMGVNSGAVSVHLHMLSPKSAGLFHQAISQSGNALCPWAIVNGDKVPRIQKILNKCKNMTDTEIVDCLRSLNASEIVKVQPGFADWFIDPLVPIGPTVELPHQNAFLSRTPYKILRSGKWNKVPFVLGVNADEGLLHSADIVSSVALTRVLDWEWEKAAPITLIYRGTSMDPKTTSENIREYYFGNVSKPIEGNDLLNLTKMYSDRYFFTGTHHTAKLSGLDSPIYLYLFNIKGSQSTVQLSDVVKGNTGIKELNGISHYDQLQYLFNTPFFKLVPKEEHETAQLVLSSFSTFIINGQPSTRGKKWTQVSKESIMENKPLIYNLLNQDLVELVEEPWSERVEFWDKLSLLEFQREIDDELIRSLNAPTTQSGQKIEL